ncbi:hypothetical protein M0Q28_05930 [Patescibacteria group bacterium]|jgi:hypothetical protein|nr:hypothetical protein [Patescibacteria group bacterium]
MPNLDEVSGELQAKYSKLSSARDMLDAVQEQMDGLAVKYDTVSPEDVVTSAGKLVAAGLAPEAMAGMLADMPDNSQALQDWVAQHQKDVAARSEQLDALLGETRHQMGVVGLRQLMQRPGEIAPEAAPPQMGPLGAAPPTEGMM